MTEPTILPEDEESSQQGRAPTHSRREEVINGALRVFAAKGYRAATIEDIANELEFTRAALYYYVDSKQELLTTLVFRPTELLIEAIEEVHALDADPAAKLREAIRAHLRIITERRDLFTVMLREQVELPPEKLDVLREKNRTYHRMLSRLIAEGVEDGDLATGNPDLAALFLIGAINWTLQWFRDEGPMTPEDVAKIFGDIALSGLESRSV